MFKVYNKDTRKTSMMLSGDFIFNLEQILHLVLVFPLLTLKKLTGYVAVLISIEILISYLCA